MRISLVELLNATSSMNTKTRNAIGRRNLRMTFLRRSLNILKHKLSLSFGEQFGLDNFVGERLTIAAVGMHNSFALSMLKRFISPPCDNHLKEHSIQYDVLFFSSSFH